MKSYALITGAAGGLGKAFAAECASRGWNLFITDINQNALAPLAVGLERLYGIEIITYACDLTDPIARESLWQAAARQGVRFHMLVNVAGADFEGPFNERRLEELRLIVRLNIEATVEMTRRVLQFRDPMRTLRVINVSSLAGYYPMPVKAVYAASKRFLLDLSRALNQEMRASGVTVTALCPAGMPTTHESLRGIDAQGFMGQVTTCNVGDVAARTVTLALKGRSVYIPGVVNHGMQIISSWLPVDGLAWLIGKRWRAAREKSCLPATAPRLSSAPFLRVHGAPAGVEAGAVRRLCDDSGALKPA